MGADARDLKLGGRERGRAIVHNCRGRGWCSKRTLTLSRLHRKMEFKFRFISLQMLCCLKVIAENPHRSIYLTTFNEVVNHSDCPLDKQGGGTDVALQIRPCNTWNLKTQCTSTWGEIHV